MAETDDRTTAELPIRRNKNLNIQAEAARDSHAMPLRSGADYGLAALRAWVEKMVMLHEGLGSHFGNIFCSG